MSGPWPGARHPVEHGRLRAQIRRAQRKTVSAEVRRLIRLTLQFDRTLDSFEGKLDKVDEQIQVGLHKLVVQLTEIDDEVKIPWNRMRQG